MPLLFHGEEWPEYRFDPVFRYAGPGIGYFNYNFTIPLRFNRDFAFLYNGFRCIGYHILYCHLQQLMVTPKFRHAGVVQGNDFN